MPVIFGDYHDIHTSACTLSSDFYTLVSETSETEGRGNSNSSPISIQLDRKYSQNHVSFGKWVWMFQ